MHRFSKWLKLLKKAAPYKNVFLQIIDVILTKIRINISPSEYYFYEFYKGSKTWEERVRYIGLDGSLYWPYELNRLKFNVTLTSKYVQKNLIMGFGLPTPRLITTIGHDFEIKNLEELRLFLSSCRQDIVFKPISGMGGHSVLVLNRRDKGFFMGSEEYTPEKIWNNMTSQMNKGFLVEEKVSNNDQLDALFPHSLNCFRVCTLKLQNQPCKILTWGLKLGRGKNVVDNIGAGGIFVLLDEKGRTLSAHPKGYEQFFTHHPDTGAPLVGIQMEGGEAVRALALEASRKFGFMGTIGWDIGLTKQGPVIIEGNNLWGPMDQKVSGGFITEEIAQGLRRHTFLSRWDRSRMFPRFYRKMKAFRK
jgi:hypothetical protein